jgi:hypothetical protein
MIHILRGLGETDSRKKLEVEKKISWQCPFECIPFTQQYGHVGCMESHSTAIAFMDVQGVFLHQQYGRAGCIPFNTSTMEVQGVALSVF